MIISQPIYDVHLAEPRKIKSSVEPDQNKTPKYGFQMEIRDNKNVLDCRTRYKIDGNISK